MKIEIKEPIKTTIRKLKRNCNGYYYNRSTKLLRQVRGKSSLYSNTKLKLYFGMLPMAFLSSNSLLSPHLP